MKALKWRHIREFLDGTRISEKDFPVEVEGWPITKISFCKTPSCEPKTAEVHLSCPAIPDLENEVEELSDQICTLEDQLEESQKRYRSAIRKYGKEKKKKK